jgi:hypothetical protein
VKGCFSDSTNIESRAKQALEPAPIAAIFGVIDLFIMWTYTPKVSANQALYLGRKSLSGPYFEFSFTSVINSFLVVCPGLSTRPLNFFIKSAM